MYQKLVSVIIPTYNRAHLVVEAIQSVKAQSYPAIQIIVADDGSQDDTAQSVAKFENVEYYYQENKGQGAARNLGLSHAKGEYIASLDSDDIWHKDFLKAAVAALERYQVDFVFLNWTAISETEQFSSDWERSKRWQKYFSNLNGEWSLLNAEEVRELFIKICPAPSSALLIRRSSFISCWNEEMKIADDWFLILEMVVMKPCRAAFTLSSYWTKHIHSSNVYHGREKLEVIRDLGLHDEVLIARRFQEQLTFAEKAILQRRLATHHFNFGRLNWRRDGFSLNALRSIATAFTLAPAGSVFYSVQLSFNHLKNRFRLARDKDKQSREA
jgi:glycosyltransferase involved in cell wall biosynthesis